MGVYIKGLNAPKSCSMCLFFYDDARLCMIMCSHVPSCEKPNCCPITEVKEPQRPRGKWVGILEYCKHLEEETGERYAPTGLGKLAYCNQCWQANDRHSNFCPNCGADMRGADDD